MKVYISLQKCRVALQEMCLKKSGNNKYAGYTYFELGDFLPAVNKLMLENNLCSFVNFDNEMATLTIVSVEDNSSVTFSSPMSTANLKGCHDVQNLGAVQTYIRRYLYTNAFEIVENDVLDMTHGKEGSRGNGLTESQVKRMYAIANKAGIKPAQVLEVCKKEYGVKKVEDLNKQQYNTICIRLESKAGELKNE